MKKLKKKKRKKFRAVASLLVIAIVLAVVVESSLVTPTQKNEICFTRECNPKYWSEIPPMPSDFITRKNQFVYNAIPDDPTIFTEAYWKQPEWMVQTPRQMTSFYQALEDAMKGREVIWCVGIYDAEKVLIIDGDKLKAEPIRINPEMQMLIDKGLLKVTAEGLELKGRFWIRSCPAAQRYFGVRIYEVFLASGQVSGKYSDEEMILSNPKVAKQYLSLEPAISEFVLGRYFPKLESDYIKEVKWDLTIKKDIPKGWHIIALEAGTPTRSFQVNQSEVHGYGYTDANVGASMNPRQFKIYINVI